jgi:RimJ/RimL family protein N-acetyltransferase
MGSTRGEPAARETFQLQPRLVGKLLELRPLRPDEFEVLYAAASDPLIWEQHPEPDRYTREVFQRYFDGAIASGGAFAIIERSTGRVIGSSRYCNLKPDESEVEIGWTFLQREFWGGTYNAELKRLMIDHALRFVDRVVFVVGEHNTRSRRALEKIGARLIRTTAEDENGQRKVVFAIGR